MRRYYAVLATAALLVTTALPAPSAASAESESVVGSMRLTAVGVVTYAGLDECYVESTDRSGAIRVLGSNAGIALGDLVSATGVFSVVANECALVDASIERISPGRRVAPFAMSNRAVGGGPLGFQLAVQDWKDVQWVPASGANNTGMLVTVWGKVTAVYECPGNGAKYFYLDDGSGLLSDLRERGILVYSQREVQEGEFVAVTGVSAVEQAVDLPPRLIRCIVAQDALTEPTSDEFDDPVLGPEWSLLYGAAGVSLTEQPGWLSVTTEGFAMITRSVWGDWDLVVKMKFGRPDGTNRLGTVLLEPWMPAGWHAWDQHSEALSAIQTDHAARVTCMESGTPPLPSIAVQVGCRNWYFYDGTAWPLEAAWPGDTCFVRLRHKGYALYVSASSDGIHYTAERTPSWRIGKFLLRAWAQSTQNGVPFTATFDYFRFSGAVE